MARAKVTLPPVFTGRRYSWTAEGRQLWVKSQPTWVTSPSEVCATKQIWSASSL